MRLGHLVEGRLVRRYKRFLVDVKLRDGQVIVAHCANPGSMLTCAPPGARVWLSCSGKPNRRLAHTWEFVEVDGRLCGVNTARANQVVAEALSEGRIRELEGYDEFEREVPAGTSRLDFRLRRGAQRCWVEVKMVTMAHTATVAAFPDSVTARGARHLDELVRLRRRGDRAVLLFCCLRSHVRGVRPADEIDPAYGSALRRAAAAGVEVIAYACRVTTREVIVRRQVPVLLDPAGWRAKRGITEARPRPRSRSDRGGNSSTPRARSRRA